MSKRFTVLKLAVSLSYAFGYQIGAQQLRGQAIVWKHVSLGSRWRSGNQDHQRLGTGVLDTVLAPGRQVDKISFLDDDLSIQMSYGKRLIEDDYEITLPDFSSLLDLDYQKRAKGYDLRTNKRFQVRVHAFALIRSARSKPICLINRSLGEIAFDVFRSKPTKLGRISNISMGGLAFRYIDSQAQSNESSVLDVLLADSGFYLENVSFKTISDIEISEDVPIDSVKMRQLRVQFKDLTPDQKLKLAYFIRNHG